MSLPNASTVEDAFRAVFVHMQTISIKYPSFVKVQSWVQNPEINFYFSFR